MTVRVMMLAQRKGVRCSQLTASFGAGMLQGVPPQEILEWLRSIVFWEIAQVTADESSQRFRQAWSCIVPILAALQSIDSNRMAAIG